MFKILDRRSRCLFGCLAAILSWAATDNACASRFTVLYLFKGGSDGYSPEAGLIADASGNLYGTTYLGGLTSCDSTGNGCGTVFKLAPDGTETVLYRFGQGGKKDGAYPFAGLVMDQAGNLFGTTSGGGASYDGTVFEIAVDGSEKVL